MDGSARRHRPSNVSAMSSSMNAPVADELRVLVEQLKDTSSASQNNPNIHSLQQQCDDLRRIRQILIDHNHPSQARSAFRHVGGLQTLLHTLRSVSGYYNPASLSRDERIEFFELLKTTLDVLSEALNQHSGNRRYFAKRVEGDGWRALEEIIASTGVGGGSDANPDVAQSGREQLFGCLLAFALGEESINGIFRDVSHLLEEPKTEHIPTDPANTSKDAEIDDQKTLDALRRKTKRSLAGNEALSNPEIVLVVFSFWKMLPDTTTDAASFLSTAVLIALEEISSFSTSNLVSMHSTGVLGLIMQELFGVSHSPRNRSLLQKLADRLIILGSNSLDDAQVLIRAANNSDAAAEFLLKSLKTSRSPAFVQFDHSFHGYSSIEIKDVGKPFPPGSGYSFTAWFHIDKYDSNCHTNIFGAYDGSQTSFLLAYLSKDTHQLILQTSASPEIPSVRFKRTLFQERRWYHIGVVHRPGRRAAASLYVNGSLVEEVRCTYPSSPQVMAKSTESFASMTSNTLRHAEIQAFLGTPHVLASRLGKNVVFTQWSLASFHLFQEALSGELIAVHQKLGPRYSGNFQDCLGSFQTYRASAELNMYNELLHVGKDGKEAQSDIVQAIRVKGSIVLPETRVLLSISAKAVMDNDDRNHIDESQLIRSLSKKAVEGFRSTTRNGGNSIVMNAAVPSINEALTVDNGVGVLTGDPVVAVPQSIDDACWRIGGCTAIGLKLVQLARSKDAIIRAVRILFESIEDSWRNSEAMEKENGFAVLAGLLREKLGLSPSFESGFSRPDVAPCPVEDREQLGMELLKVILQFVGYNLDKPEDSMIINPLAYRVLLIDFDTWRMLSNDTQRLYYKQFVQFAKEGRHAVFNAKRLVRMRIVKRFLDALKAERFTNDILGPFLEAFKVLIQCSLSGDILRSLALYITFALQEHKMGTIRPARSRSTARQTSLSSRSKALAPELEVPRSTSPVSMEEESSEVSRLELGIHILQMYADLLCQPGSLHDLKRFAKTVTNKWLLYLLAEPDPRIALLSMKILARLLVTHGSAYVKKFAEKNGGFAILKNRLRAWWNVPAIWTTCFAILFGVDVATIDYESEFNSYTLSQIFSNNRVDLVYPEILPVIMGMLESGLRSIINEPEICKSNGKSMDDSDVSNAKNGKPQTQRRPRSMSLEAEKLMNNASTSSSERLTSNADVLQTIIQFLSEMQMQWPRFRDFTLSSNYVQELLFVLFPVVVSSDNVSAETELSSRGNGLTFEGNDVPIRPLDLSSNHSPPIVRASIVEPPPSPITGRATPLRRGSSFILLTSHKPDAGPSIPRLNPIMSPTSSAPVALRVSNAIVNGLLDVVIDVFLDQILQRKDFTGFGLFLKVPPGFQEHQAYFESYVLQNAMSSLLNNVRLHQKLLIEPRVLTNLGRYCLHMAEAVFEGWFIDGALPLLDFIGFVLEYLERPEIARMKNVRLCSQAIASMRSVFFRVALLRLSELDESDKPEDAAFFLDKLTYWQPIILSQENTEHNFLRMISYLLFTKLMGSDPNVRSSAANFWRCLLVQKPEELSQITSHSAGQDQRQISSGFTKLIEVDNDAFLSWVDDHRGEMNSLFSGPWSRSWEEFVAAENLQTETSAKNRVGKRREKLKMWHSEEMTVDNIWHRHETATSHWRTNVHASERLKHQRAQQDQQDNLSYIASTLDRLERLLRGPCELFDKDNVSKWQLDETESRNRMRVRIFPDRVLRDDSYQPKRRATQKGDKRKLTVDTKVTPIPANELVGTPAALPSAVDGALDNGRLRSGSQSIQDDATAAPEDDYEIIDDPKEEDGFEDKNRKVMRSLQHGDQIKYVCNVSRIVGLEACEGLLIVGKDSLYLLDNYFQRADGEVVGVWQAPMEERDPYLAMISGRDNSASSRKPQINPGEQTTRNWRWAEVISISKRRFLFRDVAIEIFFTDGRSYLLTTISPASRNDLHTKLVGRAPAVNNSSSSQHAEDMWRIESLRNPEEAPQSFGSKFASVFNAAPSNPATRKWMKGEISNFAYLMLVNTMAGRTFNDLTQYPVFPWVIADYTSKELDLTNPRTFRDLSKPMGCQVPSREAEFRERYNAFGDMGDDPPYHYGTHYSSAMTVTSYLIRLQPFVQSYLLLQGGSFDHADRLFYSIEKAWLSASREAGSDVRELTPEFFYLPEFLTNINGYEFGLRQNSDVKIDNVTLPPWAKGDPRIFIAKNREALESPYVSMHLHAWIDLIFGYKQRGEAAIEATNVFHPLSYHGAKDLDSISDSREKLAIIGWIHNFGQTPHQVFPRAHVQREEVNSKYKRVDNSAEYLSRLPHTLLKTGERVASLLYSTKQERLLCSASFRINIPPNYEQYMEWGFADGSVRFYGTESRKLLGLFEHMHQGHISTATFVDSRTLITAGTDSVLIVWTVAFAAKSVELPASVALFGHKSPVVTIAASKAFSTFLSADTSGRVLLWDLNRREFVREIKDDSKRRRVGGRVQCARISNVSGNIALARGRTLALYTINGSLLLEKDVCDGEDEEDEVAALAFYEGVGNEWVERELVFTGHRKGVVNVWHPTPTSTTVTSIPNANPTSWTLTLIKRLNHIDTSASVSSTSTTKTRPQRPITSDPPPPSTTNNFPGAITCILPMAQTVYTGDEEGHVVGFPLIGGSRSEMLRAIC
ncbi:beach-domain-containing protein [Aulographum hederae CBS 113979]|uniref:Beige protein homolog 1 n=1 Tax=Aulographum hederae CBS 113979 TaxID=1176131 RepID=A0A6G1H6R1_9PEZI|nr:beach-domain-containing protein [Aulographum hederae CBS 113979]